MGQIQEQLGQGQVGQGQFQANGVQGIQGQGIKGMQLQAHGQGIQGQQGVQMQGQGIQGQQRVQIQGIQGQIVQMVAGRGGQMMAIGQGVQMMGRGGQLQGQAQMAGRGGQFQGQTIQGRVQGIQGQGMVPGGQGQMIMGGRGGGQMQLAQGQMQGQMQGLAQQNQNRIHSRSLGPAQQHHMIQGGRGCMVGTGRGQGPGNMSGTYSAISMGRGMMAQGQVGGVAGQGARPGRIHSVSMGSPGMYSNQNMIYNQNPNNINAGIKNPNNNPNKPNHVNYANKWFANQSGVLERRGNAISNTNTNSPGLKRPDAAANTNDVESTNNTSPDNSNQALTAEEDEAFGKLSEELVQLMETAFTTTSEQGRRPRPTSIIIIDDIIDHCVEESTPSMILP